MDVLQVFLLPIPSYRVSLTLIWMNQGILKLGKNLFFPKAPGLRASLFKNASSGDLSAGLNVALLAIPQGMAYALVAGLPIHYGLLGSAIAALMGGIFGGGKFITLGPTNATAVLLFGAFAGVGLIGQNGLPPPRLSSLLPVILITSAFCLF